METINYIIIHSGVNRSTQAQEDVIFGLIINKSSTPLLRAQTRAKE
jgi:hypothetical protein